MAQQTNNPPDVIIELSYDDAQMLLDDSDAATHQLLMAINENKDGRREFIEKLCKLMEFKRRVKLAVERGMRE